MRPSHPIKQTHRFLFLALQADVKEMNGDGCSGIGCAARLLGCNANTLANSLNPNHESAPPSLATVIELIQMAQAKRSIMALAQLVGQYPMDFEIQDRTPEEAIRLFLSLMTSVSAVIGAGSEFAKDGDFSANERIQLLPLLQALMKATGELMHAIKE